MAADHQIEHMLLSRLGNAFMAFSFFILVFIYYPVIRMYIVPTSAAQQLDKNAFYIEIPKIGIGSPVIPSVDPFDERVYRAALEKGIAHAKGTPLPGEPGVSFLFAHSSDLPWRISRYNTPFLRLGELEKGDIIIVRRDRERYEYRVLGKEVVWPDEVEYLLNAQKEELRDEDSQLILQTCTPIGTSFQRLLVFAELVQTQ